MVHIRLQVILLDYLMANSLNNGLLFSKIWTPFVPPFLQEYTGHKGPVNAVQWSPAGSNRYLARYIIIWKLYYQQNRAIHYFFLIVTTAVRTIKQLKFWTSKGNQ
jgi:hypothetical protein